jgi:hypothetical protein
VGKSANISDHFGEKLNETHVRQALNPLLKQYKLHPTFAMIACETELQTPVYILFIEEAAAADETLLNLGGELDVALQENFHYRYCQNLGQLDSLRIFRINQDGLAAYLAACQSHGQRAGDIKPATLHRRSDWMSEFSGDLLGI